MVKKFIAALKESMVFSKSLGWLRVKVIFFSTVSSFFVIGIITAVYISDTETVDNQVYVDGTDSIFSHLLQNTQGVPGLLDKMRITDYLNDTLDQNPGLLKISVHGYEDGELVRIAAAGSQIFSDFKGEEKEIEGRGVYFYEDRANGLFRVIRPIISKGKNIGKLEVYGSLVLQGSSAVNVRSKILLTAFFGVITLVVFFYLMLNRLVFIPIDAFAVAFERLSNGSGDLIVDPESGEIAMLDRSLAKVNETIKVRADMFVRELETISVMNVIDQMVLSERDMNSLLDLTVRTSGDHLKAERTSLVLLEDDRESIKLAVVYDRLSTSFNDGNGLKIQDSLALSRAVNLRSPVIIDDISHGANGSCAKYPVDEKLVSLGIRSVMVIPLVNKGKILGMLNFGKSAVGGFSSSDMVLGAILGDRVAIALDNNIMYQHLKSETEALNTLLHINEVLCSAANMDDLMEKVIESIQSLMKVDSVSIMLLDKKEQFLETRASTIEDERFGVGTRINIGEKVAGLAVLHGEAFIIQDGVDERLFRKYERHEKQIVSSIIIPLKKGYDKVMGVLCINSYDKARRFYNDELKFVRIFATQVALAIDDIRLFEELINKALQLKESHFDVVKVLSEALVTKDTYTGGHGARMLHYAKTMAEMLGFSEVDKEQLLYAALLHDIGKIGISDVILNKLTPLTREDLDEIKTHPQKGAEILKNVKSLENLGNVIYHHQERWDGTGYPDEISGESIPLASRIIAVLDAYDAMTTDRVYRNARSESDAIEEMLRCSGTQFDPEMVKLFLNVLELEGHIFGKDEKLREII